MPGNLHGVLARLLMRDGRFSIAINQHILDVRFRARRIVAPHELLHFFKPLMLSRDFHDVRFDFLHGQFLEPGVLEVTAKGATGMGTIRL